MCYQWPPASAAGPDVIYNPRSGPAASCTRRSGRYLRRFPPRAGCRREPQTLPPSLNALTLASCLIIIRVFNFFFFPLEEGEPRQCARPAAGEKPSRWELLEGNAAGLGAGDIDPAPAGGNANLDPNLEILGFETHVERPRAGGVGGGRAGSGLRWRRGTSGALGPHVCGCRGCLVPAQRHRFAAGTGVRAGRGGSQGRIWP